MLSRRVDFGPAKPVTWWPAANPSSRKLNCGVKCRPPDGMGMATELGLGKHARQPQGEVGKQKHENDWNRRRGGEREYAAERITDGDRSRRARALRRAHSCKMLKQRHLYPISNSRRFGDMDIHGH